VMWLSALRWPRSALIPELLTTCGALAASVHFWGMAMVILLLSLTGTPPLSGFVGRVYLFTAAVEAGFH
ncbi:MAG: proton-conducting transporter membrane subunit, partial [Roseovarius sp.]|nr:proton-conducting transporter membrane subunit [Roseovarius sp.]